MSNHGGRIRYVIPPLQILPEIVKEVGSKLEIIVDGGIESGVDAYKAMALGADAVSVGKHLIPFVQKGGAEAVASQIGLMTEELCGMMAFTGVKDISSFDPTVIRSRK